MRSASRLRFQVVLLDSVHLSTFYSFVHVFMHVNVMLTINFPIIVEECYHRSRLSLALFSWEQARLSDVSVHMWVYTIRFYTAKRSNTGGGTSLG